MAWRWRSWSAITACVFVAGCADVIPYHLGDKGWKGAKDESADQYCSRLALAADSAAQAQLGFGIVLSVFAGSAIVTGAAIGPDTSMGANWAAKNRNTMILASGGLLAVPATILLMRSKDTSKASGAGALALSGATDADKWRACLQARSDLATDRSAEADYVQKDLSSRVASLQDTQQKQQQVSADAQKVLDSNADDPTKARAAQVKATADANVKALGEQINQLVASPAKR